MTFAHYPGEDPAQTAAHVAALEVALEGARERGDADNAKLVEDELRRITGQRRGKQTRGAE